jgi:16S rRNA U516 pseudouridylate synthase RsuA-like enzyme
MPGNCALYLQSSIPPRLFTVGRLDVASVGLVFVTNDGDWAQKVAHPSTGITKVRGSVLRAAADVNKERLRGGMHYLLLSTSLEMPSPARMQEYSVTVGQRPSKKQMELIEGGCEMDGTLVKPVAVGVDATSSSSMGRIHIVVSEGRNREVRMRMQIFVQSRFFTAVWI